MLVLGRRKGEKLQIGRGITITVCDIRGGTVRLGVEAPAEIPVVRFELVPDPTDPPAKDAAT